MQDSNICALEFKKVSCALCLDEVTVVRKKLSECFSFKIFMRYLGVDISKYFKFTDKLATAELGLCDKCDLIMNRFLDWYHDSELIRLFMNNCVQSLFEVIKTSEKCDKYEVILSSLSAFQQEEVMVKVNNLRNETLRKCYRKLASMPRVTLERVTEDAVNDMGENFADEFSKREEKYSEESNKNQKSSDKPGTSKNTSNEIPIKVEPTSHNDYLESTCILKNIEVKTEPVVSQLKIVEACSVHAFPIVQNCPVIKEEQNLSNLCPLCFSVCEDLHSKSRISNRLSFRLLLRYLGVNFSNVLKLSESRLQHEVDLCVKCNLLVTQFTQLYQDFEIARLFMNNCIQAVFDVIQKSENCAAQSNAAQVQNIPDNLRKNILEKGLRKLVSVPRINLKRIDYSSTSTTPDCDFYFENDAQSDTYIDIKMESFTANNYYDNEDQIGGQGQIMDQIAIKPKSESRSGHSGNKDKFKTEAVSVTGKLRNNCKFCSKTFLNSWSTKQHMISAHSYKYFSKKIPSSVSESKFLSSLQTHLTEVKKYGNRKVGCPYCIRTTRDDILKGHILVHHFDKVLLALENCKQVSPTQTYHLVKESAGFECPHCNKQLKHELTLKRHLRTHSEADTPNASKYTCTYCKLKFDSVSKKNSHEISSHTMTHLEKELPPGTTQNQLESVLQSVINQRELLPRGRLTCTICSKAFHYPATLRSHLLLTHLESLVEKLTKPLPHLESLLCSKCKRSFPSLYLLNQHRILYMGKGCEKLRKLEKNKLHKKYNCPFCENRFTSKDSRTYHILILHPLQYLGKEIPTGTTKQMVEKVIFSLIECVQQPTKIRFKCVLCCKKGFSRKTIRNHIFLAHVNTVIKRLE